MPTQSYRLRIRTANDDDNELIISSVRSDDYPYIASIPNGDGQEVDLLTGAVRTGAYVVEVVDAIIGSNATGTIRVLTNELYDSSGTTARPHLLSRRAYIEMSTNDGSSWTSWCAGYISNIRQVDAIRYAVTVSNTRRVEQTEQVFTWQTQAERDAFPKRGCIFGGPIIEGLGGATSRTVDSGGWTYEYKATTGTSTPVAGNVLALSYVTGAFNPLFEQKKMPGPNQNSQWFGSIKPFIKAVNGDASTSGTAFSYLRSPFVWAMPDLTVILTESATEKEWLGEIRAFNFGSDVLVSGIAGPRTASPLSAEAFNTNHTLFVKLYAPETSWPTLPSVNTKLRVRVVTKQVSESSPLYIQAHPVDIASNLYSLINLPVSTASANSVKAALGNTLSVTYRIAQAQTMAEFLENSLFGPFGFACRINQFGEVEFFSTRVINYTAPAYTIGTNDIVGDGPPVIYDLDESTVVTGFSFTEKVLTATTDFEFNDPDFIPDGIIATEQTLQYSTADTSTYSTRVVSYNVPGMVTDNASFISSFTEWSRGVVFEGFNRFERGAVNSEVEVLRTSTAASAEVGDFIYINASYYPNRNYRIGESTVGARVAQVVRREERPESVMFKLVDAGGFVQPATAATVSIAASTADPRRVAQFTITNAATLNSGNIGVAVEWATGSSTPTGNGQLFTRYEAGSVPTGAVQLPAVRLGATRVHVRVRSEVPGIFPSAWSAWQAVTLNAWTAPTSIIIGTRTSNTAVVSWSLNTNTTDQVDVYVAPGSVAPSDWTPYRINTLPAGTTSTLLTALSASTAYIVGVAFRDSVAKIAMTPVTATFTTTASTSGTASRPAGLEIIDGVNDASLSQGNVLALYAAQGELDTVIERAPDSSGSPGTFEDLMTVPATTTTYIDYLPKNAAVYWYRIRHETSGKAASSATPSVSATPTGILPNSVRPDAVAPIVTVTTSESGTTATVTIAINDPQNRLVQVRFRERTNNGPWSDPWTVDSTAPYAYSATIPASGFVEIEYEVTGFAADGVSRILAAGIESFDADTVANIVSASGTFSLAGALTLGIQADSDTNSFKYAVATTDWASDAAALSAATGGGASSVNARNVTAILTGPYAVGTTVYLAIAAYPQASYGGTVSGPYRYSFLNGSRDTIPLIARARLFSVSATEAVVRVAVASPIALSPNTATIAYSVTGLSGVTPVTGQTVTPVTGDNVDETSATSYKDFTIPRPAANAVPGRITFTVTATGRVAATPSATIVAQDIVAPSLKIVTTPAANDYSLVVTWDGTIVYDLDGVSQSVSGWTSPRTVTITRNDFLGATKVAAFAVTKNSITASQSVNVPPKDNANASITIGTQTADDATDDYEFSWSTSGFPTGTTYNLTYTTTTTAGVVEQGSLTNQTSPVTVSSGFNIGASPTYQMRIDAIKSGTLVLTASRSGTFLT